MNSNGLETEGKVIEVPASTGWPLVAAFGFTLVFAGLLTHVMVSVLGAVTLCMGLVGWFRQVLPDEVHESVALELEELVRPAPSPKVRHLEVGELGHRARLPLEIYPYSAGVRGGLVGGAAMAVLAILYGIIGHGASGILSICSRPRVRRTRSHGPTSSPSRRVWCSRSSYTSPHRFWSAQHGVTCQCSPRARYCWAEFSRLFLVGHLYTPDSASSSGLARAH